MCTTNKNEGQITNGSREVRDDEERKLGFDSVNSIGNDLENFD